jgi:hypothetical protein
MDILKINTKTADCASIAISFAAASVAFAEGSRYDLDREYLSEIRLYPDFPIKQIQYCRQFIWVDA